MPYLENGIRASLAQGRVAKTPGELSFSMSQLIKGYIAMRGTSYGTFNDIVGAMECLKLELYRRLIGTYEQKKCDENSDVF
jgi:hypothetical protein